MFVLRIIHRLELDQHRALLPDTPLQLPHKRSAKALILPLPGNNNFNQIIRLTVVVLLKIPHGEAQQPALVLQQQAEGVLPGHDLMDALSCGLNGSLSVLIGVVVVHIQFRRPRKVLQGKGSVLHIISPYQTKWSPGRRSGKIPAYPRRTPRAGRQSPAPGSGP